MVIRSQQIHKLERYLQAQYENRLVRFLYDEFPEAGAEPEEDLRTEVGRQIARAREYGLETEQQIASYLVAAWLLGSDFDLEFEGANEILSCLASTPEVSAQQLAKSVDAYFAKEESGDTDVLEGY